MPPGVWRSGAAEGIRCVGPGDEAAKQGDTLPQVLDSLETVENHDETVLGLWITLALSALIFVLSPWTLPKLVAASRGSRLGATTFAPGYFWPAFLGEPPPLKMSEFTGAFGADGDAAWAHLDPDGAGVVDADTFAEYAAGLGLDRQKAEYIFRKLDCNMDTILTEEELTSSLGCDCDWEQVCAGPRTLLLPPLPEAGDAAAVGDADPPREEPHSEQGPPPEPRLLEQPSPTLAGSPKCPPEAAGHEEELGDYLARLGGRGNLVALELSVKGLQYRDLADSQVEEMRRSLARTVALALRTEPGAVLDMRGQAAGLSLSGQGGSGGLVARGFVRLPPGGTLRLASERLRGGGSVDALVTEAGQGSYFELDSDGDGTFSREEFVAAAKAYLEPGVDLPGPAAEDLFQLLDADLDGRLDGDEFFARRFRACALPQVGAAAMAPSG